MGRKWPFSGPTERIEHFVARVATIGGGGIDRCVVRSPPVVCIAAEPPCIKAKLFVEGGDSDTDLGVGDDGPQVVPMKNRLFRAIFRNGVYP